ncbi:extracellular solute-binding protein, partial [Patescibacteria group bacterium]|nr:extracellular solute-binding protein [Patescibacteria group bacterium]
SAYQAQHPHIKIEYRKFRYEEYEKELLNAFAENRGPDIFSLHNTWINEWRPRLEPSPSILTMPFRELKGSIKKEVVTVIKQTPGLTVRQLANDFLDVVSQDAVIDTEQTDPRAPLVPRVYGVPLAVDTLVMFYNRDILNASGIPSPATHWLEFQEQVKKITKLDELGTIIQPAAAIGTADNVERASDILSILMIQNGARMTDNLGIATFNQVPAELSGRALPPGAEALIFYTDFANPEKEVYTWNDKMPNSLTAFANGQVAYFFGYAYHLPTIRNFNPELNFGIAPLPQIEGNQPMNFANYWLEVVANKTEHVNEAWDFLKFAATAEMTKKYLDKTGRPTALRSLVNSQLDDLDLSVFASQLPTAVSWYRGSDAEAQEEAFQEMIRQMITGTEPNPVKIVDLAATKVNQTID